MTQVNDELTQARQHARAGRLAKAEAICRGLLDGDRPHSEVLALLGEIQCRRGDHAAAAATLGQAISLQPANARLHRDLGYVHAAAGNNEQAIACYRSALRLDPSDLQARNNLGVALKHRGMIDEAMATFQEVLQQQPDMHLPLRNLADLLCQRGKWDEALDHYRRAIQLAPDDAQAHCGLADVLATQGKSVDAIRQYEEALRRDPQLIHAENNLATALCTAGRLEEAVGHYQRALELCPDLPATRVNLGKAFRALGNVERAVEEYQEALRQDAACVHAIYHLASAFVDLGQFDDAVAQLEKGLALDPDHVLSYELLGELASQNQYVFPERQLRHMESLLESDRLPAEEACWLRFTLGGIFDKQGRYDDAFRCYRQGNEQKYGSIDAREMAGHGQAFQRVVDESIALFTPEFFEQRRASCHPGKRPIFVVGMPRSGTTLVEQIIASHPRAAGAGELQDIGKLATELPDQPDARAEYPDWVQHAGAAKFQHQAQRYLDRLVGIEPEAARVVDKMPANFVFLGFIALLFSGARVIHCRRDPLDVCLSCYFRVFNPSVKWAWRLEDIGFYFRQYQRLMDHWRVVLPLPMYEVSYEQLVRTPEASTREIIDFCGLDWNDGCLEYYRGDRAVQTASRVQVRQPIYTTSAERWKKYRKHLGPLQTALADLVNPET